MEDYMQNYMPILLVNIDCLLFWFDCLFFILIFSLLSGFSMEKSEALPQFYEDKHIQSKPVHLARFSKDGKLLAIVHTDLSLSIWDSQDILVNTFEQSFYESRSKNRSNSHHIVFLDWSATNKYIYLIIDCTGYQIDVYSKTKKPYNFT